MRTLLRNLTRALRHKNYFYFFSGHGISLVGTWMQQIAVSWLVYRLTHSPFLLGLSAFFNQIPGLILMSLAGVIADRFPRRSLLVITQTLALVQAAFLAFLVLSGNIQVWHLFVLGFTLGVVNTFDIPARQAFLSELVPKTDLGNAIALNSTLFHGARFVGPMVAGALIALWSEGICFLLNAFTYLAVIGALLLIRIKKPTDIFQKKRLFSEWKEGFDTVRRDPFIRTILLRLTGMSFFGMPYLSLLPVFAKDVHQGDSHTLGVLMGSSGLGALAGALLLAAQKGSGQLKFFLTLGGISFSLSLAAFSQATFFPFATTMVFTVGFGMMLQMAAANTLIQNRVEDRMRGRVMSFFALANMGITPLGVLTAGFFAEHFGAKPTLLAAGLGCLLLSLGFWKALQPVRAA